MQIYCSTGGFEEKPFYESAKAFLNLGIDNIELSAGAHSHDALEQLMILNQEANLMLHNYFPPPSEPFVLNLASKNAHICAKSIDFFKTGIDLSAAVGAQHYGIHAGFLFDLSVAEIGKQINSHVLLNRDEGLEIFISNVNKLGNYASDHGVTLLVENNVLSKKNFEKNNEDPLLLTTPGEITVFFNSVREGIKLLLDFGHMKVSSNTLNFDLHSAVAGIQEWVGGYHMSETNGELDDHLNFDHNAWFFPFLDCSVPFATLEIKNSNPQLIHETWLMVRKKVGGMLDSL